VVTETTIRIIKTRNWYLRINESQL
jgi:hypothetical protein